MNKLLSKSKYLQGWQCLKQVYLVVNHPDLATPVDEALQAIFDQGTRLGELARIFTDSGQIFVTAVSDADDYEVEALELLNQPNEILVVNVGESAFNKYEPSLSMDANPDTKQAVKEVCQLLKEKTVIQQYAI